MGAADGAAGGRLSAVRIRPATAADAAAIAAIYAYYVDETAITFEEVAPDAAEMAARIARVTAGHPWLVAEEEAGDGAILGYAYGAPMHARAAYRWSVETTVYLAADRRGRGIGRALYADLLDRLARAGFVTAVALITLPGEASVALHRRFGFVHTGVQTGIGFKHGRWRDVAYMQRDLAPRPDQPR